MLCPARLALSLSSLGFLALMIAPAAPGQSITAGEDGFRLRSADERFALRLRGQAMIDGQVFTGDEAPAGRGFYVRRARLEARGTLDERFGFRVRAGFGEGEAQLVDAFLEAQLLPALSLRVGRAKVPVGLEWLQSARDLFFAERAYPSGLVPRRDVGAGVHGELLGGRLTYDAGLFNGAPDGGSLNADADRAKEAALRLFARPFRETEGALRGLGVGVGTSLGPSEGIAATTGLPSYSTPGGQAFFRYRERSAVADGARRRVVPQAYYFRGPVGLMGEYAVSAQGVRAGGAAERLANRAWQVVSTVVLTGEAATYERLRPAHPYDPAEGRWGAVMLVARAHGLHVDPAAFPRFADPQASAQQALTGGIGVNWHLTANVRLMLNYEQTRLDGAAGAPLGTEHLILGRAQVVF